MGDGPGRRPEGVRVLGVDAAFDGVPVEADVLLAERQRRAGRDPDLLDDEVEPVIISVTVCSTWRRVFISMK